MKHHRENLTSDTQRQTNGERNMRTLKILLFLIGLTLIWIPSSGQLPGDSIYCAPVSRVRKLVAVALRCQTCDSLVQFQEREINAGLKLQVVADSLLFNERRETVLAKVIAGQYRSLYEGEKQLTKIETKKKRQRTWLIVGICTGWVLREFLVD